MSRRNCKMLDTGDQFPPMSFNTIAGALIALPDSFGGRWNILLFYRGHW